MTENMKMIAEDVALEYMTTHPDADKNLITRLALSSANEYDSEFHDTEPVTFVRIGLRTALLHIKRKNTMNTEDVHIETENKQVKPDNQQTIETEPFEEKYTVKKHKRLLPSEKKRMIDDYMRGMTISELAEKYGKAYNTIYNNLTNWHIINSNANSQSSKTSDKTTVEQLQFTDASINLLAFIGQQLNGCELISSVANNEKRMLECVYKREDNNIVSICLTIT